MAAVWRVKAITATDTPLARQHIPHEPPYPPHPPQCPWPVCAGQSVDVHAVRF